MVGRPGLAPGKSKPQIYSLLPLLLGHLPVNQEEWKLFHNPKESALDSSLPVLVGFHPVTIADCSVETYLSYNENPIRSRFAPHNADNETYL